MYFNIPRKINTLLDFHMDSVSKDFLHYGKCTFPMTRSVRSVGWLVSLSVRILIGAESYTSTILSEHLSNLRFAFFKQNVLPMHQLVLDSFLLLIQIIAYASE